MSTTAKVVGFDGGVTYWTLSSTGTPREALLAELTTSGLEKFCPREPTLEWCVQKALGRIYEGTDYLVRPLALRDGFSLVAEYRGQEENAYRQALAVRVTDAGETCFTPASARPDGWDANLREIRATTPASKLGMSLTSLLYHLGGVALRKTGGVYWLPREAMPVWRSMARAVVRAGNGKNVVYVIKHRMDEAAMRAVRDAVVEDVGAEVEAIYKEVVLGELGRKALEKRVARAANLAKMVENYERYINASLDSLRESLDKLQTALVSGKFQSMATA